MPPLLASLLAEPPLGAERARHYRVSRAKRGMGTRSGKAAGNRGLSRLAALAMVIAVPSVAASPASFGLDLAASSEMPDTMQPMGFETPGQSFPGSAFYYLADEDTSAPEFAPSYISATSATAPAAASELAAPRPGDIARALVATGSATDRSRAQHCLTLAIYYEAASESVDGQRAVAQVVLNRVAHPAYPNTVCGVVFQGSERRTGCQFSFTCDGAMARKPSTTGWNRAYGVAADALAGRVYAPIGLATHYHTLAVSPYWAPSLQNVGTIGFHTFYTFKGAAGRKSAFGIGYRGGEPVAAPRPRSAAASHPGPTDPLAIARQYETRFGSEPIAGAPGAAPASPAAPQRRADPAPVYSPEIEARGGDALFRGDNLPGGGTINPALERSGQWLETRP